MVKVEWNRYSKSYLTFQFILYDLTLDNTGKSNQSHWSVFLYGNSAEMRKIEGKFCGKNIGMNMSLFLYGNSAEMRETAWGKFCGEKTEAWKWDYFCMEFCGNEGNWGKIMYSNIFIYVSLIGNGTWKNVCQQQITEFFSTISIQFRTFRTEMLSPLISVHFHKILPFCWNVRKFSGNVRKYRSNSFREFHRILQKRFPYSSAEFYENFLAGLKLDDIWRSHIDRTHIINFTS